jgi:hypothetical protein
MSSPSSNSPEHRFAAASSSLRSDCGREADKRQSIDLEGGSVEHNVFAFGGNDAMLGIAKRFAQAP